MLQQYIGGGGVIFMRKLDPRSQTKIANVLLAGQRKISLRGLARRHAQLFASAGALCCAATVSALALLASSPAAAQFICITTPSDINCTNSGTAPFLLNKALGANQNATTTNSGTANAFESETTGGGNAAVTNSGTNSGGMLAVTTAGGNATATNTGNDSGDVNAFTLNNGKATANNSGAIVGGHLLATTVSGGDAIASNSGSVALGVSAVTEGGGNATVNNSGINGMAAIAFTLGGGDAIANNSGTSNGLVAVTEGGGNATAGNSGTNIGGILASTVISGNAMATNSGSNSGGDIDAITSGVGNATVTNTGTTIHGALIASTGGTGSGSGNALVINSGVSIHGTLAAFATGIAGNATVFNSGTVIVTPGLDAIAIISSNGTATLTNVVGGRVFGDLLVEGFGAGISQNINYVGGNWLQTFESGVLDPTITTINTRGAPFVVSGDTVAVLDPTAFALADRALVNFTGGIAQIIQDRFNGLAAGGGGPLATSFAPTGSGTAATAQAAFAGIPSLAMSYASDSRPLIGKAAAPAAAHNDTTVWASSFGGERKQRADGSILPTTDTAYGGAMGVDRVASPNLRLGAFVGAGASREEVELSVQSIDATYVFGGVYGRFDWRTQYLDFALYGGGVNNKSTRGIANNTVAGGFENATASYGGWFISPEVTYGYRIPVKSVLVTPRLRVRYVGGELDGYSESGSMQNLTVGRRAINDLEERAEVELSTVHPLAGGTMKALVNFGAIGLERLGNPTVNTVLLAQSLSFTTPGERNAVGGVLGAGLEYWPMPNVSVFLAGEGTAMSDKSASFAGKGGARVSF
jgi:outer membrane autotransporter protein